MEQTSFFGFVPPGATAAAGSAAFSADMRHRYRLHRLICVGSGEGILPGAVRVMLTMLNPSTADADNNDPTIRRGIDFAARFGAPFAAERRVGYVVARTRADGSPVFGGHVGTIYQATNAIYTGRSKAETRLLLPDGSLLHGRALSKIRRRDRGWRYASAMLERHGASPLTEGEDAAAWVEHWVSRLTRPLRHGGNHRYLFPLERGRAGRALRRCLPAGLPYPKFDRIDA